MEIDEKDQVVYSLVKRFFAERDASQVGLFDWTWRLAKDNLLPKLRGARPSQREPRELNLASALAAVGEEPPPFPLAAILVTWVAISHMNELGRVPTRQELVSTIDTCINVMKVSSQNMGAFKNYLSERILEEKPFTSSESTIATGIEDFKKENNQKYEVLTNGKKYISGAEDVNRLRDRKNDFDLWWDKEEDEVVANGNKVILQNQIYRLLELVLEYNGKVLRDETVCQYIWEDREYDASRPIDQLFSHLYSATHQVINSKCVKARRGLNQRKVDLDVHYCCIRPLD